MAYKIVVEKLTDTGERYPASELLYTQILADINLIAIIHAANGIEQPPQQQNLELYKLRPIDLGDMSK